MYSRAYKSTLSLYTSYSPITNDLFRIARLLQSYTTIRSISVDVYFEKSDDFTDILHLITSHQMGFHPFNGIEIRREYEQVIYIDGDN